MKRPPNLIYALDDKLPLFHLIVLGLQYACMLFPYLILVVILGQTQGAPPPSAISFSLIALGVGALLQMLKKGPIGSGYLAPPVVSVIYFSASLAAAKLGGLGLVYGMTLFAGLIECGFSFFLYRLRKFFPPIVSGLIIIAVGLQLGLLALSQILMIKDVAAPLYNRHLIAGGTTLLTMILLTVWSKGMLRLLSPFIGLVIGFLLSIGLGIIPSLSLQQLSAASWLALPQLSAVDYSFSPSFIIPFVLAAFVASLRSIGTITTCQKINDLDWKQPDVKNLKKGILADGIGCMVAGILGVPGTSCSPSLVGVSQATGATSRTVALALAAWLFILAILPKFTSLFLAIPLSVMGAALLYTACFMIAGGMDLITSRKISTRSILIIGLSLLLGISHQVFPDFYAHLPSPLNLFTSSMLSIVTLSAVLLNLLFLIRSKEPLILKGKVTLERNLEQDIEQECLKRDLPVARIKGSFSALTNLLRAGYIKEGLILCDLLHDPSEVILKFTYTGSLPPLQFDTGKERQLLEETAFSLGLANFLSSLSADQIKTSCQQDLCEIELIFNQ